MRVIITNNYNETRMTMKEDFKNVRWHFWREIILEFLNVIFCSTVIFFIARLASLTHVQTIDHSYVLMCHCYTTDNR